MADPDQIWNDLSRVERELLVRRPDCDGVRWLREDEDPRPALRLRRLGLIRLDVYGYVFTDMGFKVSLMGGLCSCGHPKGQHTRGLGICLACYEASDHARHPYCNRYRRAPVATGGDSKEAS